MSLEVIFNHYVRVRRLLQDEDLPSTPLGRFVGEAGGYYVVQLRGKTEKKPFFAQTHAKLQISRSVISTHNSAISRLERETKAMRKVCLVPLPREHYPPAGSGACEHKAGARPRASRGEAPRAPRLGAAEYAGGCARSAAPGLSTAACSGGGTRERQSGPQHQSGSTVPSGQRSNIENGMGRGEVRGSQSGACPTSRHSSSVCF